MKSLAQGLLAIAAVAAIVSLGRDHERGQRELQELTREAEILDERVEMVKLRHAIARVERHQANSPFEKTVVKLP